MLHILGMGYHHPDALIDNRFLEDLETGTNAEWIMDKIGIETRRSVLPLDYIRSTRNRDTREARAVAATTPTELAQKAASDAMWRAGIRPEQIGLVICNSCNPNHTAPSEGQRIAEALGAKNALAYDVFSACPAFALHLDYLASFEEEALPEYVLCVSTAALTLNVNYDDRSDGAIWGDGAGAWIVSARHPGKLAIRDTIFTADPTRCEAVVVDTHGHFHQDGRAVRDFSVRQTVRLIKQLEEDYALDWSKDVFIGHQANATMLRQITENRGIPESNHWHNAREYGNQAGAGAPIVLAMHWDEIRPGQRIVIAVVGAGLSWGSALLEATAA